MARLIREGRVIPFLGAGVNLCGRGEGEHFETGKSLPSGRELARYLAAKGEYKDSSSDLVRVSQALAVLTGPAALYDVLHEIFDHDYPPTELHRFLAELPGILREQGRPQYQVIITTNYDDALERAFAAAQEPADLVVYVADGQHRGKFLHRDPQGTERIVHTPNKYERFSLDERTVIVKIHGAIDRLKASNDSYVITEDHYIDYLTRTDVGKLLPVKLMTKIKQSHFLFLGYSLKDWNLRAILHRVWGSQKLRYNSWSVQLDADRLDERSWSQREVEILAVRLEDYVAQLRETVLTLDDRGPA